MNPLLYEETVRRALQEDLGRAGDLTSEAVIPPELEAEGAVVTRQEGRVAGVAVAALCFHLLDPAIQIRVLAPDGSPVETGQEILRVRGSARALLAAERTALNFLGRLSGVATATAALVAAVAGTRARVVDTRKTTPGLRALEKYAVRVGGGSNHRFGADDAVLIKDNHRVLATGVREAVARARDRVGHTVRVEVEVDNLEELAEALEAGADAVLLDNFSPAELRRAVELNAGRALLEASGGVTLENAAEVAATGVDLISVGALTHSAPWLDVSLELAAVHIPATSG